ncbi:hypothetical protein BDV97DRAFT_396127 [Delphinella strobiligena]|nr:hypothetical protein BDV97DRAFT_396127 [Delphinella strobiligena]
MIEILLKSGRVDVDAKAGDERQNTALLYTTMWGRSEATQVLIKWNAAMELGDRGGTTPLEQAILFRKVRTASVLIENGAESRFRPRGGMPESTILHAAVSGASSRTRSSIVRDLLEEHPRLRDSSFLDQFTSMGWTPLHKAAYFGDVHGVKAPVLAGANWKLAKLRSPRPTTGTPLEICEKAIHELRYKSPSQDYFWLKDRNPLAIKEFKNSLEEIKSFLQSPEWHLSMNSLSLKS